MHKKQNGFTFKLKTGYYFELLTLETMKLLGSTKSMINKDKTGENVPYLQIAKVVLIHCNIANNGYQQYSRVLYILIPNILKTFSSEY